MIRYRDLYESSTSLLLYNVIKDLAATVAMVGLVKFKKKNKFTVNGKEICGVLLQQNGMFIIADDTLIEVSDEDKDFQEFHGNPYNVITLYENVCKELGLMDSKKRKKKNED